MRRRYQKPRIRNVGGYWIAQFRDLEGRKRKVSLGPVERVKKSDAEAKLADILAPVNARLDAPRRKWTFGEFVLQVYLPFYRRKWKRSTAMTNEDRIRNHLTPAFGERPLASLGRDELQDYLDQKTSAGLSHSVVAHLRWDLRQILGMAKSDGHLTTNPAEMLFVPGEARRPEKRTLTLEEVRLFFSVLGLRERVIGGLAILAGMRPGEIFALTRGKVQTDYANVEQRVYRGELGTPKTTRSKRWAAFGEGLATWLREYLELTPDAGPDSWLFPSEKLTTPLAKDNCWRRHFHPRLKAVGLEWANFQVMRRTHSCRMDDLEIDPQVRADQMGHSVDVNQNTYTQASLERRRRAVSELEKAVGLVQ